MPSRRRHRSDSQERSESRSRSRSRHRSRSRSPGQIRLPYDASPISESDYFLKSDEFRVWLRDEKHKYLDELTSERSLMNLGQAWNGGKLSRSLYSGVDAQSASSQTAYRWSFASKASKADSEALRAAREDVDTSTYKRSSRSSTGPSINGPRRMQGPTLPSQSDLTLARETTEEQRKAERDYSHKRERKEAKEKLEEVVGPKAVGKEALLEKKRAKREADRSFREKGDDDFEADESTLMGGGDSFQEQLARREAARRRREEKKFGGKDEKVSAARERAEVIRQKDEQTMTMFMQMAKEKFG
ncbi:unnamed protein product [Somion occarium]|uniref:Uncharacterized protein n=1 Tax=Somion occarium TaxID=3059160 RepID=A0ABP1CGI7_9APHY